jgi:CBS domain-containing protein
MRVRDMMTREVATCRAGDDLGTAGKLMAETGCGCLPVVDEANGVIGVLTDRDVCSFLCDTDGRPSGAKVLQAMHAEVWSCAPDDTAAQVLAMMRLRHVRRLPVVDEKDRLVGIVSLDDIAMEAKPVISGTSDGPVDTDVARTMRMVGHALPHGRSRP